MRDAVGKVVAIAAVATVWLTSFARGEMPNGSTAPVAAVPSQELWVVFMFGLVFLVTRVVLAICFPHPSKDQEAVFRTVLSLAAAGIAAAIPGLVEFESQVAATTISATGALAVFSLVYLLNPASSRREISFEDQQAGEQRSAAADVQPLRRSLDDLSFEMRALAHRVEQLEMRGRVPELGAEKIAQTCADSGSTEMDSQRVLLVVFAVILVGMLLFYALLFTSMSVVHGSLLRVTLALLGAGVGALIPGTISVATSRTRVVLGGVAALALFVIIYFFAAISTGQLGVPR